MKKYIAFLLIFVLIAGLCACDKAPTPNFETEAPPTLPPTSAQKETVQRELWQLTYDPGVWVEDEDVWDFSDNPGKIVLEIPDGDDSYIINAEIRANEEDAESFRSYLTSYGFDPYEYAVNSSYDLVNIGGVDCLKQEGNYYGSPCLRYFGRVENAGVTVFIEIIGEYESDYVDQLLDGLTFTLTDVGNTDFPWPWEGTPFQGVNADVMIATHTLQSRWTSLQPELITTETFDHQIAVIGENVYILADGQLLAYRLSGGALVYESQISLDSEYQYIFSDREGSLWVSDFMEDLLQLKDGSQIAAYADTDYVSMHPSGQWGISWFTDPECQKLTFRDGILQTESISFPEVDMISELIVDESYIYVCGSSASDDAHRVFVYDLTGKLALTLDDADGEGLGSITYVGQSENGFIGLDGNMRSVILWTADGTYIGEADDGELFGTDYPWLCGGAKLPDGSFLILLTEDRADQSAMELTAYILSGF